MKKISFISLLLMVLMVGCSSGVSKEEYDKVVKERDDYKIKYEELEKEKKADTNSDTKKAEKTTKNKATASTAGFDANTILSQLEIKEHKLENHVILEIKNNSQFRLSMNPTLNFYDAAGSLIGVKQNAKMAIEPNYSFLFGFTSDSDYDHYEYSLNPEQDTYTKETLPSLTYEVNETEKNLIFSVTNNGEISSSSATIEILYFNGEELVDYTTTYAGDSSFEIKPGTTENTESQKYSGAYTDYKVLLSSYGD